MLIHSPFTGLLQWKLKINGATARVVLLQPVLYAIASKEKGVYWYLYKCAAQVLSLGPTLLLTHLFLRHSPTAGTTPAAITYGTHKDSKSTEMTGAASLRMMNWRSMLRIPFA